MSISAALLEYPPTLEIGQGALAGKPFHVQPWHKRFLQGAFKWGVTEAALTVTRGAGKTTFLTGIGLAHLEADGVKQPGAEIKIVCSTIAQGQKCFDHVLRFLRPRQVNDRYGRIPPDVLRKNSVSVHQCAADLLSHRSLYYAGSLTSFWAVLVGPSFFYQTLRIIPKVTCNPRSSLS